MVEIVYSRMSVRYRGSRFSLVELPKLKGALSLLDGPRRESLIVVVIGILPDQDAIDIDEGIHRMKPRQRTHRECSECELQVPCIFLRPGGYHAFLFSENSWRVFQRTALLRGVGRR